MRVIGRHQLDEHRAILLDDKGMHYYEHLCARTSARFKVTQEPRITAPNLSNHTRTGELPEITIRASILCPDCDDHGFVTDGRWESC